MVDSAEQIERGNGEGATSTATPNQLTEEAASMAPTKSIKAPAFQYYPKDFLTDSNVLAMSLTEIGAYWKLISICWIDDTLPTSPAALARLVGVPQAHFARLWPAIAPCFKEKSGRLIHPRLERERAAQAAYRAKQADNGKKGGRPRNNPSLSSGKAVGSSGETQTEAKKSSSSASSSASASTPSEERGRRAPLHDSSHRAHVHCGRVCVPGFLHHELVRRWPPRDDVDQVVRDWYLFVEREWSSAPGALPEPRVFWNARFAERWPSASTNPASVPRSQRWRPNDEAAS